MEKNQFVDLANVDEIPARKMKHVETDGNEILVAKVDGKFYAGQPCLRRLDFVYRI